MDAVLYLLMINAALAPFISSAVRSVFTTDALFLNNDRSIKLLDPQVRVLNNMHFILNFYNCTQH